MIVSCSRIQASLTIKMTWNSLKTMNITVAALVASGTMNFLKVQCCSIQIWCQGSKRRSNKRTSKSKEETKFQLATGRSLTFRYCLFKVSFFAFWLKMLTFLNYYNQVRTEVSTNSFQKQTRIFSMHVPTHIRTMSSTKIGSQLQACLQ